MKSAWVAVAGRAFVDTSVFVHSVDTPYTIATRKLAHPLPPDEAATAVEWMTRFNCVPVDSDLVLRAIKAGQRWQLSHRDALMVAAARQAGCDRLLTEDLSDGASYDGLRVENPFRGTNG